MWIYFFLFILCSVHSFTSQCKKEFSYNIEDNSPIVWETKNNEVVPTLCLNKNNTLVKRQCISSEWIPATTPLCYKRQKIFKSKCAENDKEYGKDLCIYTSPPNPMSTNSFNSIIENINDTLRIAKLDNNITEMWLPVMRREKYGKFVWLMPYAKEKNNIYQHPLLKESNKDINIYNYDCIAATNITVIQKNENEFDVTYVPKIVNCSLHFQTVYVYKKVNRYFVPNYNTKKYGSPLFYSSKGNKAFYTHKKCKKIAEPRYIEDNFLIKHLVENKTCRIGIKYAKNVNNYVWESTNEVINYTDWISSIEYNFDEVVISANGWSVNVSKLIECYVCEIDRHKYITDLILTTNKDNLFLTAYSFDERYYSVVCRGDGLQDIQYKLENIDVDNNESDPNYNKIETINNRNVWKLVFLSSNAIKRNHFYCSGSLFPNGDDGEPKTRKVFFGRTIYPKFAFKITFKNHCRNYICDPYLNENFTKELPKILNRARIVKNTRPMRILNINDKNGDIKLLYHVEIENKNNINLTYEAIKNELKKLEKNASISINLKSLQNCQGCLPNDIIVGNVSLRWNFTKIGVTVINENCIQSNYLPITRKCTGDFLFGGKWMNVSGLCNNKLSVPQTTKQLRNLRSEIKNISVTNVTNMLANLTQNSSSLIPWDILIISDIFKNISSNVTKITENKKMIAKSIPNIVSNLVATNRSTLKSLLKSKLKATNTIINSIESIMENVAKSNLNENGSFQQIESNFVYQLFEPSSQNITGIALIRPRTRKENPPFTDYKTKLLTADSNITELIEMKDLEAASFIPKILYDKIRLDLKNVSVKISMMFYYNDSLFIETKHKTKVLTKVFSISILGYNSKTLYSSVPVIFRNFHEEYANNFNCGYWDIEVNDGEWSNDVPAKYEYLTKKNIQICKFRHLTNFALLLGRNNNTNSANDIRLSNNILIYLTAIGTVLSVFGIFAIFTTAAVFKYWRKMAATKIILNVSICLLLQLVLLYGNVTVDTISCIVTGTLLHYSVLSGFMWSLIMAYLQYWRFVKVLGNPTSHLILKAFFVGWIVPMIPVAIVHIIDSKNYMTGEKNMSNIICYPTDTILYTTVILPVAIIVLINLIIFCLIIYKVHTQTKAMSNFRYNYDQREMTIKEAKLGVFLFFSLSLTWIFGLLTYTEYCNFCEYIFVITASSQGFMLFVYHVLFNKDIRLSWMKLFKTGKKIENATAITGSKTNLSNEEMDNMNQKTIKIPEKKHQFSNTKEKEIDNINSNNDNNLEENMNTLNLDELRKRLKTNKENTNNTDEIQNSSKSNFDVSKKEKLQRIEMTGVEATTKKQYNPERIGGMQQKLIIQELMKQQEKRNSPFRK